MGKFFIWPAVALFIYSIDRLLVFFVYDNTPGSIGSSLGLVGKFLFNRVLIFSAIFYILLILLYSMLTKKSIRNIPIVHCFALGIIGFIFCFFFVPYAAAMGWTKLLLI